jgi:hypothetical protein
MLSLKRLFDDKKPTNIPRWVYGRLNPNILAMLMDCRNKRKVDEDEEDNQIYTIEDIMGIPMPDDDYEETGVFEADELEVIVKKPRKPRSDIGKKRGPRKIQEPQAYDDITDTLKSVTLVVKKRGRPKGSKNKVKT